MADEFTGLAEKSRGSGRVLLLVQRGAISQLVAVAPG